MNLTELTAITPVDGRYRNKVSDLALYFSEFALIKYRVKVEVEYFIALIEQSAIKQLQKINDSQIESIRGLYLNFSLDDAQKIKDIEQITNHDVKAVEYFIKEKFNDFGLSNEKEFVHFGLTSQDINNTAIPMLLKDFIQEIYFGELENLVNKLDFLANEWSHIPMLAKTHGQPASPTRVGKEIYVYVERIKEQIKQLKKIPYSAKFGGATGNFNAHHVAYPEVNWVDFANNFVNNKLFLSRSQYTTQIEHYDNLASIFDCFKRINTILIDFNRDFWQYISMEYFTQKVNKNEVGSSAMPHKVNPIDFENAEGNLGIANAIFSHLSDKLPISRLQRDLTDSTVLRNIGVPLAHTIIALKSSYKGLNKIQINTKSIENDLAENWAVVAEAIQTILRREGYANPYEKLKELTRTGEKINANIIAKFIESLDVSDNIKEELRQITPYNYAGIELL